MANAQKPPSSPPYIVEILNSDANGTLVNFLTPPPTEEPTGVVSAIQGALNVPRGNTAEIVEKSITNKLLKNPKAKKDASATQKTSQYYPGQTEQNIRDSYPTGTVWPEAPAPASETNPPQTTNNTTPGAITNNSGENEPTDPRLLYLVNNKTVIPSFSSKPELQAVLVDGFVLKDKEGNVVTASSPRVTTEDVAKYTEFYGVPSLMNYNAYINLQAAGGKVGNKYLVDRENQPRWYEVTAGIGSGEDSLKGELTVKNLVEWCQTPQNQKFPYKYQDFVFLKWWKKIPLNYMITLRRYTRPVNDSVNSAEQAKGLVKPNDMVPAATAVTFLGEDAGNKLSSIIGPIEAGLKWKEVKADVWEVNFSGSPLTADSPQPGLAKALGFLTGGADAAKSKYGGPPPDPYNDGPYSNKILGPVNVIDSTKGRDRGLSFKHDISLVFEYSTRSIGSINAKAAMLDVMSNLMLLTYNEAAFWGGMNRYMPQGAGGDLDPFLGGDEGRAAWLRGDPEGFFKALSNQFTSAIKNIGDAFAKFLDDPISGLKSLASGAASSYMKLNTAGGKGFMQGIHSLLTGAPVGEWHLTVGSPLNPMMMIGNLICTGITIEFNDELGPDDFPTELKATVKLEHGMPRDRAGIESMFNKGQGRMYSVPKGYEANLPSTNDTANDTSKSKTASATTKNSKDKKAEAANPLLGDPAAFDRSFDYLKQSTAPEVKSASVAVYSHGVKFIDKVKEKSPK